MSYTEVRQLDKIPVESVGAVRGRPNLGRCSSFAPARASRNDRSRASGLRAAWGRGNGGWSPDGISGALPRVAKKL